jgi:FOG: WD40-like repeat
VGICVHSCPTIGVDGTLYLAGAKIFAVDPVSFSEKWSFEGEGIFESSPALSADGVLFAGCYDGKMYALNGATGTKLWEFATGGAIHSSPALGADGTVYFGSGDGRLYALDGLTGQKHWDFASDGPVSGSPVIGPDGWIYVGSEDNKVYALNHKGIMQWQFVTAGRVTNTPALTADGTLYIASQGGGLFALNGQTGKKLWQFGGASATPAIGPDGTIYSGGFALHGTSPLADGPWPKFHRDASNRGRLPGRPVLGRSRSRLTPDGFAFTIHSEAGDLLTIESSADLLNWTPLETLMNATGRFEFLDATAAGAGQKFYRVYRVE